MASPDISAVTRTDSSTLAPGQKFRTILWLCIPAALVYGLAMTVLLDLLRYDTPVPGSAFPCMMVGYVVMSLLFSLSGTAAALSPDRVVQALALILTAVLWLLAAFLVELLMLSEIGWLRSAWAGMFSAFSAGPPELGVIPKMMTGSVPGFVLVAIVAPWRWAKRKGAGPRKWVGGHAAFEIGLVLALLALAGFLAAHLVFVLGFCLMLVQNIRQTAS